jgi:hypothetical protein
MSQKARAVFTPKRTEKYTEKMGLRFHQFELKNEKKIKS